MVMVPNAPIGFWQFFDFISVFALGLIIGFVLTSHRRQNGSLLATISKTVAYTPKSSLLFSIAMTIFYPLYYAYLYFWVGPLVVAPTVYYYLLIFSAACEFVFVWVPAVPGKKNLIHSISSSIVGILMLVFPLLILFASQNLNTISKYTIVVYLLLSMMMVISLLFQKARRYTFSYELAYCVIFLICMSVIGHSQKLFA